MRRLLMVALLAVSMVTMGAGAAFAGEVTGSGQGGPDGDGITGAPSHANSICAFSGLDDGPPVVPGVTQSWGQNVRGVGGPFDFTPGDECRGGSNNWPDN